LFVVVVVVVVVVTTTVDNGRQHTAASFNEVKATIGGAEP
jgi:hypothetical protein